MTSARSIRILMLPFFLLATTSFAIATDAQAASTKNAKASASLEDQLAVADEEQDRLARQRKDLKEREDALQSQLDTSNKLIAEKDALIKKLEEQIKALKAAGKDAGKDKAGKSNPAK